MSIRGAATKRWREAVLARDGHRCRRCGGAGNLHAHHVQSWKDFPQLRLVVSNGVTLCAGCHMEAEGKRVPGHERAVRYFLGAMQQAMPDKVREVFAKYPVGREALSGRRMRLVEPNEAARLADSIDPTNVIPRLPLPWRARSFASRDSGGSDTAPAQDDALEPATTGQRRPPAHSPHHA